MCGCTSASCDVRADPILVVTCKMRLCGAFSGLRSTTTTSHVLLAIMKENDNRHLLSFGLSYDSVAQKWRILAILEELLGRYWNLKQCLKDKILN